MKQEISGYLRTWTHRRHHLGVPPPYYTCLWPFALAAVGEHFFLSLCLLATRRQNKQYPRIIHCTIISLVAGYIVVILSERAAKSQSNTFSLLPKGYLR